MSAGLEWATQVNTTASPSNNGVWSILISTCGAYSTSKWILAVLGSRSAEFWALNKKENSYILSFSTPIKSSFSFTRQVIVVLWSAFFAVMVRVEIVVTRFVFSMSSVSVTMEGSGSSPSALLITWSVPSSQVICKKIERRYYTFWAFLKKLFKKFFWFKDFSDLVLVF